MPLSYALQSPPTLNGKTRNLFFFSVSSSVLHAYGLCSLTLISLYLSFSSSFFFMEKKRWEMGSLSAKILIETVGFFAKTLAFLSSLASDPLFSIVVAWYSLILLYFPRIFLNLIFSPVLISTGILLLTLLRLGSIQRAEKEIFSASPDVDQKWVSCQTEKETETETETGKHFDPNPFFPEFFFEWNMRGPLEVIYEEYEGEEEDDSNEKEETRQVGRDGLVSFALHYPESDTGSSSDGDFPAIIGWDSPENLCFRWDEDDKESLIEIPLDGKRSSGFQVEEENLIEIDISPIGASAAMDTLRRVSDSVNSD